MPKITSFSLKNRKNRPDLYASGCCGLRPQTPTLSLYRYEFLVAHLICNRHFHVT